MATVIVFIGLFLVHFLYLTPKRIVAETEEKWELAEYHIRALRQSGT